MFARALAILLSCIWGADVPGQQPGFRPIFDGRTLTGFCGDPRNWSVEDGVLVGHSSADGTPASTTELIWDDPCDDFELRFSCRVLAGRAGLLYRARRNGERWVAGRRAELASVRSIAGQLRGLGRRGLLPGPGRRVRTGVEGEREFDSGQWIEYLVRARGTRVQHYVDGELVVDIDDRRASGHPRRGLLGLVLDPSTRVEVRNLRILPLTPSWIWLPGRTGTEAEGHFRCQFELPVGFEGGELLMTCDDRFTAWVNGTQVLAGDDWQQPGFRDVTPWLRAGGNVLAVSAGNDGGPAGLCGRLRVSLRDGRRFDVVTGTHWRANHAETEGWRGLGFAGTWPRPQSLGTMPEASGPWGDLFSPRAAIPARLLQVTRDFAVELLCSAQPGQGSWVGMTFDPQGRLIVASESGPLRRITLPDRLEDLAFGGQSLGGPVQGLVHAFDSLYVCVGAGASESGGLYRLRDLDGDGRYEQSERLRAFGPGGEHGPHGVAAGPDGMLYLVQGHATDLLPGLSPRSPYRDYAEDTLRTREWDPNGQAVGVRAPGARILRTDPAGRTWELVAGGLRNPLDLAFDARGDLFTFDSGMEWDRGLPWFRPSRVLHVIAGGEYGWRGGSAKWSVDSLDCLPAVVDVGAARPMGLTFGTASAFPERFRRGLFLADRSGGRILIAHPQPRGVSYAAIFEPFVGGPGLRVTDLAFGPDGALYFVTGGGGTLGGLYRVRYLGAKPGPVAMPRTQISPLLRVASDLERAWGDLDSTDRFVRFAARVALERQAVENWRARALAEETPALALQALLALARVGTAADGAAVLSRLGAVDFASADEGDFLRVLTVAWSRHGAPAPAVRAALLQALDSRYPSGDPIRDSRLAPVLASLAAPDFVERTIDLLTGTETRAGQVGYGLLLRDIEVGWTDELRLRYFQWLRYARSFRGGSSFLGYLRAIERVALQHVPAADRDRLGKLSRLSTRDDDQGARGLAQDYTYTAWKLEDLQPHLQTIGVKRDLESGRETFRKHCFDCHRQRPDLSGIELLQKLLNPSKQIPKTRRTSLLKLRNGSILVGQIVESTDSALVLRLDPFTDRRSRIPRADILSQEFSRNSIMPSGLLNTLTRDQILDLLACLED